ncbi:RecQ family ATP-dependent DNA helicase [Flavisolibacter tropicus]|uniref:ATP-dependent DNA helicase RecQ n=1 Tax=Flavisolibacter tropicus TaxID=1492898 RepID=A0A172TVY1_9BACT|nr:ATP-dependent DNA helicase RecQ [Flavisolibacter tropicus]ANE51146.1 ATP-dependent DNA helicase RecQ [Flavisolibacter tropicus]
MSAIHDILKQYWGYNVFRPLQEEIITSVLEQKDALALLPTGGGKSICYQVPAMAQEGICLVISPLIALMKDQVENLRKRGIMALAIYSGMSRRQIAQTLKNAAYGEYKLLYVSPERIETDLFKEYLPALGVNLIAVDEAHCISQWGYDFRPSYLKILELREELPDVPMLALTASATPAVQKDIVEKLQLRDVQLFRQSYERKNLSYTVRQADAKVANLTTIISKVPGTAIVYCKSRRRTLEIAQLLQMHGFSSHYYHAGLSAEERDQKQQDWINNQVQVMVCTNAFGMGIDKPDVRLVIHADMPDCLENYYQEAGRAGRDGKKSYAVLLYTPADIENLRELHQTRFPSFERIRHVYQSLVNFLHIPAYTGEDISYNFNFTDFVRNFQLNNQEALYALKALESDGWLVFNEKSFSPSTIVFTTNKQQLYQFQRSYPQYEPLLTTLLRTYEGIFDYPVFVTEKNIAYLTKKTEAEIKQILLAVTALRVIRYTPQNDAPQIIFKKHRVRVEDLYLDLSQYEKRKAVFIERVEKIITYTNISSCRSQYLNNYFGDDKTKACGICDNCLKTKALPLSKEEFATIHHEIKAALQSGPLLPEQLIQQLGLKKEKAWQVLEFLQAEHKISINKNGQLFIEN